MNSEIRLSKKFLVAFVVILVILIVIVVWITVKVGSSNPARASSYSAIYLSSGEIYFGEIHRFPKLYLSNPWLLERTPPTEDNKLGISIIPFKNAFWGPIDKIYLNPDQIIFTTKLRNDSQVKGLITGEASIEPSPPSQGSTENIESPNP